MECMIQMETSKINEPKLELIAADIFPIIGFTGEKGQKSFRILEFITLNGPVTSYSTATTLGLKKSTTHRIVKDLLVRRMIELCEEKKHWSGTTKKLYGPTSLGFACSLASQEVDMKFKEVLSRWSKLLESEDLTDDQVITAYKTMLKSRIKTLSLMITGPRLTAEQITEQPGVAFFLAGMFSPLVAEDEVKNAMRVLYKRDPLFKKGVMSEAVEWLRAANERFPGLVRELMKKFPYLFKKS